MNFDEELKFSAKDQEEAEDLAIQVIDFISEYPTNIKFAALYFALEAIDQEDKEFLDHTRGINGKEYFPYE